MIIEKKAWPEYFEEILKGNKSYDLRLNDFECKVGDTLLLKEWDPKSQKYTGREIEKKITYIGETNKFTFWSKADADKYGYKIMSFQNDKKNRKGVDFIGVTVCLYCHDGKGNMLLQKRSIDCRDEKGRWDAGGGSMNFGETFEEAAKRELKEEYSIENAEIHFCGAMNVLRNNGSEDTHWVALVFAAKVDPSFVMNGDPDKIDEIGWFPMNNLPSPLHSMYTKQFEMVKKFVNL